MFLFLCVSVRMKLLLVVAAALAVASCASLSLEDLEFHAWKLKFGEKLFKTVLFFHLQNTGDVVGFL